MRPSWLQRYYGDETEKLTPVVLFEGKKSAVVMLRSKVKNVTQVGYVLIEKSGKHNISKHEALHEGPASTTDIARMRRRLTEVEGP